MPAVAPHSIVLGVCPENFWSDQQFNLIAAAAELHEGRWVRLGNPSTKYAPEGRFYVYRDLSHSLRAHEIAAWEIEDQSDWAELKYLTRCRAVRRVDTPLEIIPARIESDAPNVREYLTTVGVEALVARSDGLALLEFTDGAVARVKLTTHPTTPGKSVIVAADLHYPLDAWPSAKEFQVLSLTPNGRPRRFVTASDVGRAPTSLDLATWDEIFQTATRSGGLGSYSGPSLSDLKKARDKLQEILKTFPPGKWEARRSRIERFLIDTDLAATSREGLAAYIASHPAFRSAVESRAKEKAAELRESLRAEVYAAEIEVAERIKKRESEFGEVEQLVQQVGADRVRIAEEVRHLSETKTTLEAEIASLRLELDAPPAKSVPAPHPATSPAWLSGGADITLSSPEAVVTLIEKNLSALGVNGLSARNIGFEVVAAASMGQVIFFRGSLARPLAEAVGLSLAGNSLRIERVTLGLSDTLAVDLTGKGGFQALVLTGANLACLDIYGDGVKHAVLRKRLFSSIPRTPVIVGILEDGASALPLHDGYFDLGPVLDTNFLPWKPPLKEPAIACGRLEPDALRVTEAEVDRDVWDRVVQSTSPNSGGLWPGTAISVLKRLAGLSKMVKGSQPATSFLYGWLVPRLLAARTSLVDHKEAIQNALEVAPEPRDPRVLAILSAHGMEGGR